MADIDIDVDVDVEGEGAEGSGVPGQLEGVQHILLKWQTGDVSVEASDDLAGRIEVDTDDDHGCAVLSRHGGVLLVNQDAGQCRGSVDLSLRVPAQACPALIAKVAHGDLSFHEIAAPLHVKLASGDVQIAGGQGDLALQAGHGDVSISRRAGALTLEVSSGDVELERCRGAIVVHQSHGDLQVATCDGPLAVHGGSGDVQVQRPSGHHLAISGRHGDVAIEGGRVGNLDVHLTSGDVACSADLLPPSGGESGGRFVVETGHGDVALAVPRSLPARVEVVTGHGDVESDVPLVSVGRRGPRGAAQRFVGVTSTGGAGAAGDRERLQIEVITRSGDVQLRAAGPAGDTAQAQADQSRAQRDRRRLGGVAAPAPDQDVATAGDERRDDEVRAVLDALARGDLRVDEAERLLDALSRSRPPR